VKPPGLRITGLSTLFAVAGFGAIAANRHYNGNTDWISLAWTGAAALGGLGFAGLLAQCAFKTFGRANKFANFTFILATILATSSIVLIKGPAHNFAVSQLSTHYPAAAKILSKTDPNGRAVGHSNSKTAIKGNPVVRVYHKNDPSASAQPTNGD
jgi:hypothetical protein